MPSNQMPRANIRAPTNLQEAAEILAEDRYTRHNKVSKGTIFRDALREYLINHWDELPQEGRDLLDEDLKANAGGSVPPEEVPSLQNGADQDTVDEAVDELENDERTDGGVART